VYLKTCNEILATNRGIDFLKHIELMVSPISNSKTYYVVDTCSDFNYLNGGHITPHMFFL
jgi:hypothetical protein